MAFILFQKNFENISGSLYRIAEDENFLNSFNIIKSDYKIIEDSSANFIAVQEWTKYPDKYVGNTITYINNSVSFKTKINLYNYIDTFKKNISLFLSLNPNNTYYSLWNDYLQQLTNFNLESVEYPLNISLEKYFKNNNLPSLNPLQLP
jgi:hypothetical protein